MSTSTSPTTPRHDIPAPTHEEHLMSTTTTTRPEPARPQIEQVRGVPFGRLVGVELRKMVDTRTGRWLLIAITAITAIAMAAVMWVQREGGADLTSLLLAASIPQGLLIPVLGIMTAANEWSQRTALITFSQEPRRLRVMAAKTVAALVLGLGVLVLSVLLAMLGHLASATLADGGEVDLSLGWPLVVGLVVAQVLGVVMGVAFGALFLNVPLAIVAFFLIPSLMPLVFSLTAWLREHAAWLDLATAQAPLLEERWLTSTQWAQLGTTSAIWVLLPLVVGLWRVSRREVK